MLEIRNSKKYGRGVYAARNIKAGELVEASPVLILDEWEDGKLSPTVLNRYVFAWNDNRGVSAIAFGFGSMFNHSTRENITYENNYENSTVEFMALRDIKKGRQLFIDYGYTVKEGIDTTKENREKAIEHELGTKT